MKTQFIVKVAAVMCLWTCIALPLQAQMKMQMDGQSDMPNTKDRPDHLASERAHANDSIKNDDQLPEPQLPKGQTLDEILEHADELPMDQINGMMSDDKVRGFFMFDQLEFRTVDPGSDQLGWDAFGWLGYDKDKLWLKTEGEASFEGVDKGASETDLLYSRLLTPFWQGQAGLQYANNWEKRNYRDRLSGVVALVGTLPYMIETDLSLYFSDEADFTVELELEYDWRLTQKLVLQPRVELTFAAQDIDDREMGTGLTTADFDLRLRYEISRKFAPYIGVRYRQLVGETHHIARRNNGEPEQVMLLTGVMLSF